jgi:hypothetical protein
MYKESH